MRSHACAALIASVAAITNASASLPDAYANCSNIVDEKDYSANGGKLIERRHVDLARFPRGFGPLVYCQGWVTMTGIVQQDGSVHLAGIDHDNVYCRSDGPSPISDGGKGVWRTTVVYMRFLESRYRAPRLAGKPVCVRIRRYWSPDTPHKLDP